MACARLGLLGRVGFGWLFMATQPRQPNPTHLTQPNPTQPTSNPTQVVFG